MRDVFREKRKKKSITPRVIKKHAPIFRGPRATSDKSLSLSLSLLEEKTFYYSFSSRGALFSSALKAPRAKREEENFFLSHRS